VQPLSEKDIGVIAVTDIPAGSKFGPSHDIPNILVKAKEERRISYALKVITKHYKIMELSCPPSVPSEIYLLSDNVSLPLSSLSFVPIYLLLHNVSDQFSFISSDHVLDHPTSSPPSLLTTC
jgi:hypothetical protein